MMKIKYKKIRGENRRLRAIEQWVKNSETLNLDDLQRYERDYAKFWVRPWCNLSVTNSLIPQPQGVFRERFLAGLAHIYCQWKHQLDSLNRPYYLKIWLFEQDLKRSQVVCAIGESLHFYDNTFDKVEQTGSTSQAFTLNQTEQAVFKDFNWQKMRELEAVFDDYLADPSVYSSYREYLRDKAWFESLEQTALEKVYDDSSNSQYYVLDKGTVWLGDLT